MSAPSFSSFPSSASVPQPESGPSKPHEEKKYGSSDIIRRNRRNKEKLQEHITRKQEDPDHDFVLDERCENPSAYYVNSKGNRNAGYGGSDPADIPKYHLVAHNQILGLQSGWIVVHRNHKGVEVAPRGRRKMPSLTDSKTRRLLLQTPRPLFALSRGNKQGGDEPEDFLRVSGKTIQQNTQIYRSITESQDDSEEGSMSSASESSDNVEAIVHSSHQVTIKSLEERLRNDPSSIPLWLALISQMTSTISLDSKNAVKTRAEIEVSILSRAISAHPSNRTSLKLRLKYLKAGSEEWDVDKLTREWESALQLNSVEIWMAWLDWKISNAKDGIDGVIEDAKRALAGLGEYHNEIGQLRVQWRMAVTLCQAGYTERAMALFQCQAELAFEIPQSLYGLPLATQLESLEDFWESEYPRIGEVNAKGWAAWERAGRPEHSPMPRFSAGPLYYSYTSDPFQKWAAEESNADTFLSVPTRSTDDTDDPYSTILFSDISSLLVSLKSVQAKCAFRHIWLSFLGLHIPGFSASLSELPLENFDDHWCYTHLITSSYMRSIFPSEVMTKRVTAESYSGTLVGSEKHYSSSFGPVKNWAYGVLDPHDTLIEHTRTLWTKMDLTGVDEEFTRRVFQQCRMGNEDIEWDVLAISFETAVNIKSASKLSRSMLASDQDSLLRWATHASLEKVRGRIEEARKVYHTVLVSQSLSGYGASSLWWDWAELEWFTGQQEAAQAVILKSTSIEGTTGVSILRAKRALDGEIGKAPTSWKDREAWIKLRALLELLTSSPTATLSILDEAMAQFERGTVAHERLTVVSLALLYHHGITLRNPIPTAILRERTEKALHTYPSNSVVLGMFLECERGQGVWGKVRGQLGEMVVNGELKEKDVMRRVIEVWIGCGWEHGRWQTEKERVRTGLSNAMQHERTRGSPILWRISIEFEIIAGQLDRAKQLLFQAVRACPLVKELYIIAFGPLRGVFSLQELRGWAESMAERGLRVRKELDGILGTIDDRGEYKGREDDIGDADIEHNAEEMRRLRPY